MTARASSSRARAPQRANRAARRAAAPPPARVELEDDADALPSEPETFALAVRLLGGEVIATRDATGRLWVGSARALMVRERRAKYFAPVLRNANAFDVARMLLGYDDTAGYEDDR